MIAGFPGRLADAVNTTPDALELHRLLADFVAQGARAAAMEVSSIGLDQGRLVPIEAGGRLDPDLLRATTLRHPSGLYVIAAPPEIRQVSLRIFDRSFAVTYAMEAVAVLVGLSARIGWKRAKLGEALWSLRWVALTTLIAAVLLPYVLERSFAWLAIAGTALSVWLMIGALLDVTHRVRSRRDRSQGLRSIPAATWGMTLAHFGLGVWTLGVTYAGLFSVEKDVRLGPGQSAEIGAYTFTFQGTEHREGANYQSDLGTVFVERSGQPIATLNPEKRLYPSQRSVMTESAVDHTPRRDL